MAENKAVFETVKRIFYFFLKYFKNTSMPKIALIPATVTVKIAVIRMRSWSM